MTFVPILPILNGSYTAGPPGHVSRVMDHAHKVDVRLAHHIGVSSALTYLVEELGCDNWYVACHHEHLFVFRLSQGSEDRFAVRFECTAPVEKGVYHGSKAWSLSISPLHNSTELTREKVNEIETDLARMDQ